MPIYEYSCPEHRDKVIERYTSGQVNNKPPLCECGKAMEQVEFSVPAKRNPDKGIQR